MSEKKWYVLRTAGTKEKKVADYLAKEVERSKDLQAMVDQILVPVKKEIVTKNGKRKEVDRLLFPGYVLIHAELSADLEYIIRGHFIPGLAGFLSEKASDGSADRIPVPLREEEAQRILGEQDENATSAAETEVNFTIGESVKITDGPFNGFNGTVEEILQDRSKLKVVVVIFGRKTLLELSFTQVTKE
ncbi:MAG: transcription termination/antitermination factor NusG [Bacteroidales bacterium]|nr:transcription termination/antitermination factor NusG [Bacteroidales bacterium]